MKSHKEEGGDPHGVDRAGDGRVDCRDPGHGGHDTQL